MPARGMRNVSLCVSFSSKQLSQVPSYTCIYFYVHLKVLVKPGVMESLSVVLVSGWLAD